MLFLRYRLPGAATATTATTGAAGHGA
jgi:hypothetical protein